MDYKLELINLLVNTDLDIFTEDEDKLDFAIEYAKSEIANRIGLTTATIPVKYDVNIVQGALWYLSRMGTEGQDSNTEGAVQRVYSTIPEWLKNIVPKVGVIKVAGTK